MSAKRSITFVLGITLLFLNIHVIPVRATPTLELYGTFHAMGVIVDVAARDDPEGDAVASVLYRVSGTGSFRQGFPLSRVSDTRFVGSLFWLLPDTPYDVRVTFSDPDGPLNGITVESTASTRAEIAIPAPTHSYYVSPTGSGTACTLAASCSLAEGLDQAQPGDEVILRGGVYYEGEITLQHSGTAEAPIVVRGYAGETAILDGADPATFTWTDQGDGVWRTTVNVADPHLVVADGKRLYPYKSLSDLRNLIWDAPGFYVNGRTVYVRLRGDADPNRVTLSVARQSYAFWVSESYIFFLNLTFRHYGRDYRRAIYFRNGSHNLVQGCTFGMNDLGIAIKLDSNNNVIQDNEFYDTVFEWDWDAVKAAGGLERGGIAFESPNYPWQSSVISRGNVIRRNVFHGFFDSMKVCPGQDENQGVTNETDVYENLAYNGGDDGMETDGMCSNVRIWNNTFHDVLTGISLAPARIGPVYAIRNLIYRTGAQGPGAATAFKFGDKILGSGPMYLFHNTAEPVVGGRGIYIKEVHWPLLVARNNIWIGNDNIALDYNDDAPIDFDYDDLWRTTDWTLVRWNGTQYFTLPDFSAATGQELHGRSVMPRFANAEDADYSLAPVSDLIDAGVVIPGINDQGPYAYMGLAPDIGAFESHYVSTPTPTATTRPTATATPTVTATPTPRKSYLPVVLKAWTGVSPSSGN